MENPYCLLQIAGMDFEFLGGCRCLIERCIVFLHHANDFVEVSRNVGTRSALFVYGMGDFVNSATGIGNRLV